MIFPTRSSHRTSLRSFFIHVTLTNYVKQVSDINLVPWWQNVFLVQNNVLVILCYAKCVNPWFVSYFQCSKSCGDGKKTRSVDCFGGLNAQCDSNNKPSTVADCNYGPCPEWKVGEWQEVATSTVINCFWYCCCCCCCQLIDVAVAITVVVCCFSVSVVAVVVVVVAMKSPSRLLESFLKHLNFFCAS